MKPLNSAFQENKEKVLTFNLHARTRPALSHGVTTESTALRLLVMLEGLSLHGMLQV